MISRHEHILHDKRNLLETYQYCCLKLIFKLIYCKEFHHLAYYASTERYQ